MAAILVVDDDDLVVRVAGLARERAGHRVVSASSGAEAFKVAASMKHIDVLIVDHRIPPDLGRDIAERLLVNHTEMKVMHISGWARQQLEAEGSLTPGAAFLSKPFTVSKIQTAVAALLNS